VPLPVLFRTITRTEIAERLGISLAMGDAPSRVAYAFLGLLVLAIGKHFVVPILQTLGECVAVRIRTRLTSTKAQRVRQGRKRKRGRL
jgi:hypothetical protein